MDRKMQLDVDYEEDEFYDEEDDFDAPAESDVQYNDEMSRQAVGKLFAGGGKNDSAGSPLVRGYRDGASEKPARQQPARPLRQVPASLEEPEDNQRERAREIRVVERSARPRRESATTRITKPESQNDAFQSGARDAARSGNPRSRPSEQPARQIAREKQDSGQPGGLKIEEPPRARPTRNANAEGPPARPTRQAAAQQPEEDSLDLEGFRQRYNPGEMISPPRTKNRPVRAGAAPQRDVRRDRVKISDNDLETINSFRLVIVGSCILIVALVGFLGFRVAVLAGQRNYAQEQVDSLMATRIQNTELLEDNESLRDELAGARNEVTELQRILDYHGIAISGDPNGPPFASPPGGGSPGGGPLNPLPPGGGPANPLPPVVIPDTGHYHQILSGEDLSSIVRRFYADRIPPGAPPNHPDVIRLINHVVATNDIIRDPNHIQAGWWITLYPYPMPDSVLDGSDD